jgi:glutaryl-CoA dehydrogenase
VTSPDLYALDELLEPAEIELRDRVRTSGEREVTPIVDDYWERAEFPAVLVPKLADPGIAGGTIEGYGHHAGMEAVFTFEGTDSVQALIVGRETTGLSAISGRR